jgi:hypothetical protein
LPALSNTDGDPLQMHTLIFDLDAPKAAIECLADLAAVSETEVARDAEGRFVRAELTWTKRGNPMHKAWDNTALGHLRIERKRLTAEVNSARRAAALHKLIEERLGSSAYARPSIVQSVQSMLKREPTARQPARRAQRQKHQAELAAQPEVQAAIRETLRKHYRARLDDKIPALGNRTPREAVRDPDGREAAVAALVDQIERDGPRMTPPLDSEIVRELRETLGLKRG